MSAVKTFFIFLAFIVLVLLYSSLYTVYEGQHALVLRLGKLVTDKQGAAEVYGPGLHGKPPFITTVRDFDTRLQTLDVESKRVLTAEQKYVLVDYYAKWKIDDLALYYKRTMGNAGTAQVLLSQKINDVLRAAFGKRTISEVVSGERSNIMTMLKDVANKSAAKLGIAVTDVRIKGIELPKEVRNSVFQRMSTEREQVATKHRSQGRAQAEAIRANADADVTVTMAKAKTNAERTRAKGDATAADVYAKAYNKDPEFYAFYRSLIAYKDVFSQKGDVMLLNPKSHFFKYFDSLKQQKVSSVAHTAS
ncbi:MAG: protease modulator HflC [Coxiellaceae bacterium]|nr:protease modulator HflC [Coxiellaceae bacterium]